MIWACIIWIACLSFADPSGTTILKDDNTETRVANEFHFIVNNDLLYSEEDPVSFSFKALEPEVNNSSNIAKTITFYPGKLCVKHTEILNPLQIDLPPPSRSRFI